MPTYPNTDHNEGLSKTAEMHEEVMSSILAPKIAAQTEKVAAAIAPKMSVEEATAKTASTPEGVAAIEDAYAKGWNVAGEEIEKLASTMGGPDDEDEDEE
jgi:hypothetical protein